jgi:hypothetical protein
VQPELFAHRSAGAQVITGVVVPAVYGLVTGIVLGLSEAGYLILSLLGIVGGYFAGLEHRRAEEGVVRGLTGGLLFGTFILFGHAFLGGEAKADLPHPEVLLVLITTLAGGLLGALGGWRRGRRPAQPQA